MNLKQQLAKLFAQALEEKQLTQTEAAWAIKDAPSQISLVVTGKLRGFSTERLFRMISRLGFDVEVRIKPRARGEGKIKLVV